MRLKFISFDIDRTKASERTIKFRMVIIPFVFFDA